MRAALRAATAFELSDAVVRECLAEGDDLFEKAWGEGIDSLPVAARRGALCVALGSIAEAVGTLALVEIGLDVFAEVAVLGIHGVDILALTPASQVLAVEVKGTLRGGSLPRLGRGAKKQMSLEWLSKPDNPAMVEWGLDGLDLYGAVAHFDFARMTWRVAVTGDHELYRPMLSIGQLLDASWLD